MKLIVTGSDGQLGKEILRQYEDNRYDIIGIDLKHLDITILDDVISMVRDSKPDIVINCAAYTNVDACETDFDNAFKVNAIGARNLAIASNEFSAKIVHISTDYVFDGEGIVNNGILKPYAEYNTPNPRSAYGITKLNGERFVQHCNPRHFIIRTAWLYGKGKNFVNTMIHLSKTKDELKVVNDQMGTPTSTAELTGMIKYIINTDNYGLFHGTCEGQCTWYEFTNKIFEYKGINTSVIPCATEEFPRPAPRPKYSVLDNYMLRMTSNYKFKQWQEALKIYFDSEKGVI